MAKLTPAVLNRNYAMAKPLTKDEASWVAACIASGILDGPNATKVLTSPEDREMEAFGTSMYSFEGFTAFGAKGDGIFFVSNGIDTYAFLPPTSRIVLPFTPEEIGADKNLSPDELCEHFVKEVLPLIDEDSDDFDDNSELYYACCIEDDIKSHFVF